MGQVWSSLSSDGEEATIAFYQAHRHASPTQRRGVTRDDSPYWSGAGVDSLTERCVEVIAGGIVGGRRFRLEALPAELTQLVVDVVSELGGGKNGAFNSLACADTLLESLEGARFFSLVMGGGAPGRARMDAKGSRPWSFTSLPPETRGKQNGGQRSPRDQPSLSSLFPASTLERLMVSDESQHPSAGRRTARIRTTPFDDKFLLRYAPGCLKLRFVHVSHCPHVTEVSVGGLLRGLPRLEDVVVAHCRGVGDVGGASGVGSTHLKRLAMESCLKLRGLGALLSASSDGCLASLRVLDLGRCRMLNNVDASQVARFSNLRWLDVSYTGITDEGVAALGALRSLECLKLAGLRVVDSSVAHAVRQMSCLKHLDVSRTVLVGNSTLLALAAQRPSRLERLRASFTSVSDNGVRSAMGCLKELRQVDFESCGVGEGLTALGDCPFLEDVQLADTMAGNDVAEALGHARQLEHLDISFTPMVNDIGLRYVAKMRGLRSLAMSTMDTVSEDGLSQLLKLPRLSSLDLSGCRVSDLHCSLLSKIETLRCLDLTGGVMTCHGIERLSKLRLRRLSVSHARHVGDDCVPFLMRMGRLVKLNISGCTFISDVVLLNLSRTLSKLKVLSLADRALGQSLVVELVHINSNLEIVGLKT